MKASQDFGIGQRVSASCVATADFRLRVRRMLTLGITAVALTLAIAVIGYISSIVLADPLLAIRTGHVLRADAIVVLGGDGPARAEQAIRLYRSGVAPLVLITGDRDCVDMRPMFEQASVPESAVISECASGSTWENATFSAPILAQKGIRSAVLVTSWFHMRRALSCFQDASPSIVWATVPAERSRSFLALALSLDGTRVAREYIKLGWYALRYGISLNPISVS